MDISYITSKNNKPIDFNIFSTYKKDKNITIHFSITIIKIQD